MPHGKAATARVAALVGPYLSGKTSLMESLAHAAGATVRKGSAREGFLLGDVSAEARARRMTIDVNVASFDYLGDAWSLLDCPGSVELTAEAQTAAMVADAVVVVVEPQPEKAAALRSLFKFLDDNAIPHFLFINKIDAAGDVRLIDAIAAFQAVSSRKLALREIPLRENGRVTGLVDLVSERAWQFQPHQPSSLTALPDAARADEEEFRRALLEAAADFDDALLEQLLEDVRPDDGRVYDQLARELAADQIVPVFFGSAENDNGVRRLLKALRHEVPAPAATAARLALPDGDGPLTQAFKIQHAAHAGRLTLARVWRGPAADGATLGGERVSGLYRPQGGDLQKIAQAETGEIVALGRLERTQAGDLLTDKEPTVKADFWPEPPTPVYELAIRAENRADEVKLSAALHKLLDEDPALRFEQRPDVGELVLAGQGEIHLDAACARLRGRFNVPVVARPPQPPYRETIRKPADVHARFKRQSGGHGQFADVALTVAPLPRGEGIRFNDAVVGGAVPRQYIPAVEAGVREWAAQGPLGFPAVDFEATLTGGQFHAVDSSELAFKTAARQAMQEAFVKCEPVLLEPVMLVKIHVPADATSRAQRLVAGRRGQLLGYDARPGWDGWDEVTACLPQAEIHDLIIELRSLTQGLGGYVARFDRMQELTGKQADKVIAQRRSALENAA